MYRHCMDIINSVTKVVMNTKTSYLSLSLYIYILLHESSVGTSSCFGEVAESRFSSVVRPVSVPPVLGLMLLGPLFAAKAVLNSSVSSDPGGNTFTE